MPWNAPYKNRITKERLKHEGEQHQAEQRHKNIGREANCGKYLTHHFKIRNLFSTSNTNTNQYEDIQCNEEFSKTFSEKL